VKKEAFRFAFEKSERKEDLMREREREGGIYLVMLVAKLSQSESTESHRLVPSPKGMLK